MPSVKDPIKAQYLLNEFKHSKIIRIEQNAAKIWVHFENKYLIFEMYEKRSDYMGFTIDYILDMPITLKSSKSIIDEVRLEITKTVARRLCKMISIVKRSHRYNMQYNLLHRFQPWTELDHYHKCFKLKSNNLYSDFKSILKDWESYEQYFRIHLWARQCLISFLASRGKLYELSGDKKWIIDQTEHFWLYCVLSNEYWEVLDPVTLHTKKHLKFNKYISKYGDKQISENVYNSMMGYNPERLMITASVTSLSLIFLKRFNIVFGKKSKWCIKRTKEIYAKCRETEDITDIEFIKSLLVTNHKSLLWNFNHLRDNVKKEYKLLVLADELFAVINLARKAEMSEEEIVIISELASELEHFKLTIT